MYVPRATYSLRTSFCAVPMTPSAATPWRSAATMYIATSTGAGALMVIDVLTASSGISANSSSMSATESMATPTWPTSPAARGSSLSRPICVGRSNATDRPFWPLARRKRKRSLASRAVP